MFSSRLGLIAAQRMQKYASLLRPICSHRFSKVPLPRACHHYLVASSKSSQRYLQVCQPITLSITKDLTGWEKRSFSSTSQMRKKASWNWNHLDHHYNSRFHQFDGWIEILGGLVVIGIIHTIIVTSKSAESKGVVSNEQRRETESEQDSDSRD
jgi:hypothetical protein